MDTKPRTVDNLGIDASNRYASDQKFIDRDFLQSLTQVGGLSEVSVTSPYTLSEFDQQFSTLGKNLPWARFSPPPNYQSHRKKLFTFQLAPSVGNVQRHEQELTKDDEDQGEHKEEEKKRKKVLHLLKTLGIYDQYLRSINSRRGQYHKG